MSKVTVSRVCIALAAIVFVAACAISHGSGTIGGSLTGLAGGQSVTLQNNNADDLKLTSDGRFEFSVPVVAKGSYSVTVLTQPAGQTCTPTKASGTVDINQTNVTEVQITCATGTGTGSGGQTLGGTVSGLRVGSNMVLSSNNQSLTVSANGTFVFPTALTAGTAYAVTIATVPTGQTCTVANGSGSIPQAGSVTNVVVTCQ
jgi:hypothetical protein